MTTTKPIRRGLRWQYVLGIPGCLALAALMFWMSNVHGRTYAKPMLGGIFMIAMAGLCAKLSLGWFCRRCNVELDESAFQFGKSDRQDVIRLLLRAERGENIEDLHAMVANTAKVGGPAVLAVQLRHCPQCRHVAELTLGEYQALDKDQRFTQTANPIYIEGNTVRALLQ